MLPSEELLLDPNRRGTAAQPVRLMSHRWDHANLVEQGYLNHVHVFVSNETSWHTEHCVKNQFGRRCGQ